MGRRGFVGGRDRDGLALVSERLIEAALNGDAGTVSECLESEAVDVNYIGTVRLRVRCTESLLREEEADEVEIEVRDFVTDVTPLFAAAHSGHLDIARKLLSAGADVNVELFRGYATTAAAREGHCAILDMLVKAGASKLACERALMEACLSGQAEAAELLICSEMIGPDVAQHAIVSASCKGFVDVVSKLVKSGVNIDCTDRVLLRSLKPSLHANVDCSPLVAAIVSRQVAMVQYLLEADAKTGRHVRLSAWSWDIFSGEELRVGACLGEPYNEAWCAVEYYEATGQILRLLLHHDNLFLTSQLQGRTLLSYAILCQNQEAVSLLLEAGADAEFPIKTEKGHESRPIHLAARVGCPSILKQMVEHGCDVDSRTESGNTALMIAALFDQPECFVELITAGADLGLVNNTGESAVSLAKRSAFASSLSNIFGQAITAREKIYSSSLEVFSPLHFASGYGNVEILQKILRSSMDSIDKHDNSGLTPILAAAKVGHTEVFCHLIESGADISVKSRDGQTVASILQHHTYASLRIRFEEILLDAVLSQTLKGYSEFRALHFAARTGNLPAVGQLLKMGYPVNSLEESGHSPLMLAAKEGNAEACKLLLLHGADCGILNHRGETALHLARKNSKSKAAEEVILDHLAQSHVLLGEELLKHTREGRGSPHLKGVRMLKTGLLTWGTSSKRNVACKEAMAGPSGSFLKNRRKKMADENGTLFRVVTETGREVHFEARSSTNMALWVRGVNLVSKEASSGDWPSNSSAKYAIR